MGVAVPLFESRDAYASKIDHSFAVAAYSTDAGGSVIVAIERRTSRMRAGFSSWLVAAWKRRLNASFFSAPSRRVFASSLKL